MNSIKVLIIEDNSEVRKSLKRMLSVSRDISSIYEVDNYAGAVTLLNGINPAVTILDLNLNGENGINLIPEIKNSTSSKVIVLTNESSKAIKKRCIKDGADFFFDKSLEFDRVYSSVHTLINNN